MQNIQEAYEEVYVLQEARKKPMIKVDPKKKPGSYTISDIGPGKKEYNTKTHEFKESPYQISGPHSYNHSDGQDTVHIEKTPSDIGKPHKTRRSAQRQADKHDEKYGASVHHVRYVSDEDLARKENLKKTGFASDEAKAKYEKLKGEIKPSPERKPRVRAARKLTPGERYEQEKAARKNKRTSGDVSPYFNPRSVREDICSYLVSEGFVDSQESGECMIEAMSSDWLHEIAIRTGHFDYEKGVLDSGRSPQSKVERKIDRLNSHGSTLKQRKRANKLSAINAQLSGFNDEANRESGVRNAANNIQEPIRPLGKKR